MISTVYDLLIISHMCSPPDTSLSPVEQQKIYIDRERKCFYLVLQNPAVELSYCLHSVAALIPSISAVSDAFPFDSRQDQLLICEGVANSQSVNIYQSGSAPINTDGW